MWALRLSDPCGASLRLVERTKVCSLPDCPNAGQPQPWSNFYPRKRWPDGTTRTVRAECKACSVRLHVTTRQENARYRELHARLQEDYRQRRIATAEGLGLERARKRDWYRKTHDVPPERWRGLRDDRATKSPAVDAAPFAAWLSRALAERELSYDTAAAIIGTDGSRLGKIANGKQARVSLDLVDRALLALDGPRLDDLLGEEAA